jgi:hypothetical protein
MAEWDPILVRNAEGAQGEYDSYLGELGALLRKGAGIHAVAEYLAWAEQRMGFETQRRGASRGGGANHPLV